MARTKDPLDAQRYFHSIHPFRSDRIDTETKTALLSLDDGIDSIRIDTRQQDVSPERVLSAPLLEASDIDHATVADALAGGETVFVSATVVMMDGSRRTHHILTVPENGAWVILAQGIEPTGGPTDPFGGRVVTDVTFDTEADSARVYFDDSLTADKITAKAAKRYSERSSSTPGKISYFDVRLDPSGDELVVTATVDGTTRPIHREQYPPSDRLVNDVEFIDEHERDEFDAASRVTFNEGQSDKTMIITSTVEGDESANDAVSADTSMTVGANPHGEEIVVKTVQDEQSTVVHRERYLF
jgi:hypothetical protein